MEKFSDSNPVMKIIIGTAAYLAAVIIVIRIFHPAATLTGIIAGIALVVWIGMISSMFRRSEQTIRRQNDFLNEVIDSLAHPFYVINTRDHRVVIANKAATPHLDENAKCYELTHNESAPCKDSGCPCPIELIEESRTSVTVEHLHYDADGNPGYVEIHAHPLFDKERNITQIIEYCLNITERKKIEKALWKANEQFGAIIRASPLAILAFDNLDGKISLWNAAAERIFGWKEEEVIGQFNPIVPEDKKEEFLMLHKSVQRGEILAGLEVRRKRRDGSPIDLSLSSAPLHGPDGRIYGVMSTFEDITDRKYAIEELKNAKKAAEAANRAKSEFLANMSHEIRTPLNAIIGMSRLLSETRLDEEQRDYAETVRLSSDILLSVLNDILDFSKIDAGKMELDVSDFDLRKLVGDVVRVSKITSENKGINLSFDIESDVGTFFGGDPNRLRQILVNLVNNAIKFTPKGEVRITVRNAKGKMRNDDFALRTLHFAVTDTGIGIPKDRMNRLFQPFSQADSTTTREYGGTGLGLVISKALVEMMKGEIGVESELGKGSTFWFEVVLEKGTKSQGDKGAEGEESKELSAFVPDTSVPSSFRILLVEDNEINRKVALGMLKKLGYEADVASDGVEAVNAVKTKAYHLILMDIQMPKMDGIEATKMIRKAQSERGTKAQSDGRDSVPLSLCASAPSYQASVPIIAMTAHAMRSDRERCLAAGMNDYVTKPIRPEELRRVIEKYAGAAVKAPLSPNPSPAFDKAELLLRLGNDEALFAEVIEVFSQTISDQISKLKTALKEKNPESSKFHAHSVKGAFANIAAHRLRDIAYEIEMAVKNGDPDTAASLSDTLETELERLLGEFRHVTRII